MPAWRAPRTPVVVALPAEIDLTSYERAYEQLYAAFAAGAPLVIADLTATTFCDCASLRRLVTIQRQAAAQNAQLRLAVPPHSPVRRLAWLMDLDRQVQLYPSPGEAAETPGISRPVNAKGRALAARAGRRSGAA
jgi:anti-anti-sigma factor